MSEAKQTRAHRGRTGYSTGANAAAASRAAVHLLLHDHLPATMPTRLPNDQVVTFDVAAGGWSGAAAFAVCIKDAGDDPDVTHGAPITAYAERTADPDTVVLDGGEGVGRVTREGLGLTVGGPAINPVPRANILDQIRDEAGQALASAGLAVTIAVPDGADMARRTLNPRLGIAGGISILGTTGIVRPYSTAAFKASVTQSVDIAASHGLDHLVLTTGGRSERYAMALLPALPEMAYIQMGDFVGHALHKAAKHGIPRVTLCGMVGKFAKIAQGKLHTHAGKGEVDMAFLADLAVEAGADPDLRAEIEAGNTARHVSEILDREGVTGFYDLLARRVVAQAEQATDGAVSAAALITDFNGNLIGRAPEEAA